MKQDWTPEEIALIVEARKLLKAKGLPKDADVKQVCEAAGISRKTGYQWASKEKTKKEAENKLKEENKELQAKLSILEQENDDLRFENEGRKLAWRLHDVDEWIRKKNNMKALKKPKP